MPNANRTEARPGPAGGRQEEAEAVTDVSSECTCVYCTAYSSKRLVGSFVRSFVFCALCRRRRLFRSRLVQGCTLCTALQLIKLPPTSCQGAVPGQCRAVLDQQGRSSRSQPSALKRDSLTCCATLLWDNRTTIGTLCVCLRFCAMMRS